MKISRAFFNHYLGGITCGYFDPEDDAPENVSGYRDCVLKIKNWAESQAELEILKTVFDYYLRHPEIDLSNHGGRYPFTHEEVREILQYARSIIWPDKPPVDEKAIKGLEFVNESLYDWRKQRQENLRGEKSEL